MNSVAEEAQKVRIAQLLAQDSRAIAYRRASKQSRFKKSDRHHTSYKRFGGKD
ncbi:hypothetical protein DESAMIL20_78 [Desulfurella amilsii]|uniref:Uncharacterized protein n=1 Tax=Desulfurella amilsii TaxID=1562698 RepID=A0A1X4XZL2_9BACT|nr:hypothetical protein [Desulfurella amilsii]OSS42970.1 hypothetical protein DESAMIL20_78 [Desulfurella amilsii]